jgi:hypothetical protein
MVHLEYQSQHITIPPSDTATSKSLSAPCDKIGHGKKSQRLGPAYVNCRNDDSELKGKRR